MTRKKIIVRAIWFAVCISVLISTPIIAAIKNIGSNAEEAEMNMITVWQIDSFEGGKGSRASFLQSVGDEFSEQNDCYIHIISLSSEAARQNLAKNRVPDLISYGAGTYGLEGYINDTPTSSVWARGGYCVITTDESADFSDMSTQNTVINRGIENMSGAAALFLGLNGAATENPTSAYVSLLNGKFKYLLGTQRDIYRMTTRGASFKVKPVTEFNDLYQLISVTAENAKNRRYSKDFISFLKSKANELDKIGLMGDSKLYDGAMSQMEGIKFEFELKSPVSLDMKNSLDDAITNSNINLLKNLLK